MNCDVLLSFTVGNDPSNATANPIDLDFAQVFSVFSSLFGGDLLCDFARAVDAAARAFPRNQVRYDWTGTAARDSNSFTRYILAQLGFSVAAPAGAIGWNHAIFGQ